MKISNNVSIYAYPCSNHYLHIIFICIDVYAKLMFEDHLVKDPSQQVIELPQEIRKHDKVKMNFHELEVHTKLNYKIMYIKPLHE